MKEWCPSNGVAPFSVVGSTRFRRRFVPDVQDAEARFRLGNLPMVLRLFRYEIPQCHRLLYWWCQIVEV